MMQIKKQQATKVLKKLNFEMRVAKERFAKFRHKGKLILTTAVPKGKGDMYVSNQFRKQLKLSDSQLREAINCPLGYREYLDHLIRSEIIK
jgi:hypothetical protein